MIFTDPQKIPYVRASIAYLNGRITHAELHHLIRLADLIRHNRVRARKENA